MLAQTENLPKQELYMVADFLIHLQKEDIMVVADYMKKHAHDGEPSGTQAQIISALNCPMMA